MTIMAGITAMSASAYTDSVTVVLNTGGATRSKLISTADGKVVVSQRDIEYTFTEKSAQMIVDDNGNYLIGQANTQRAYNKAEREKRIAKDKAVDRTDRYFRFEASYSPDKLDDMKFNRVALTVRRGYQLSGTPMFLDFGASIMFNKGSKSYVVRETEIKVHTDSVSSGSGWGSGTGWGSGSGSGWGSGSGTGWGTGQNGRGNVTYDTLLVDKDKKLSILVVSAQIPVRLAYRIPVGQFTLAPFVGLVGRINLSDNYSDVYKSSSSTGSGSSSQTGYSQMEKDEANRFQLAATAGLELMTSGNIYGSVSWNNDITSYNKGDLSPNHFNGINLALGFKF